MFRPVGLTRVLNTAAGVGTHRLAAGATATFRVSGVGAIPATNVSAVAINVTVVRPARAGSVAVFAGGTAWNGAATMSFAAGQTEQGMLTETLGSNGTLSVRNGSVAAVDLIGDVTGYYTGGSATAPGSYTALPASQRSLDTHASPIPAGGSRTFNALGAIPAGGVGAVLVNLTAIAPASSGTVSMYSTPIWTGAPSLSLTAGRTQQRMAVESLTDGSTFTVVNNLRSGLTLIVDVVGYFRTGAVHQQGASPLRPTRIFDTRTGGHTAIQPGQSAYVRAGQAGTSADELTVFVAAPSVAGSLSIYPGTSPWPGAATVSFTAGIIRISSVTASLGIDHAVRIRNNSTAPINLAVEENLYFFPADTPSVDVAARLSDPGQGEPVGLSCPTTDFCAVLTSNGFVTMNHGAQWGAPARLAGMSADASGRDANPGTRSISCVSSTFCAVAGAHLGIWDGAIWTITQDASPYAFNSVSCTSATFCLAVETRTGGTMRWDGTSWQPGVAWSTAAQRSIPWLSCLRPTFCMAVDGYGSYEWDGTGWTPASFNTTLNPDSVSCASETFCVAGTTHSASAEWNGTTWTPLANSGGNGYVSCAPDSFCMQVDSFDFPGSTAGLIRTLAVGSTTWSDPAPLTNTGGDQVVCLSATDCRVVSGRPNLGDYLTQAYRWDGSTWSAPVTADPGSGLPTGVSCAAAGHCLVVDAHDSAFSYDQSGWQQIAGLPTGVQPTSVSCPTVSFCMAVGISGQASTFNGSSWSPPVTVNAQRLGTVACASATYCLAIDDSGAASSWNGAAWSVPGPLAGVGKLSSVTCPSATFCMAVTPQRTASTWNGSAWKAPIATGLTVGVPQVTCSSARYCLAQADQPNPTQSGPVSAVSQWNGSRWGSIPTLTGDVTGPIDCGADQRCLIASTTLTGWNGSAWGWTGQLWTPYWSSQFSRISCADASFCAVIDGDARGAALNVAG